MAGRLSRSGVHGIFKKVAKSAAGFLQLQKYPGCFARVNQTLNDFDHTKDLPLDLSSHGVDDACLANLSQWLKSHQSVVHLNLSHNKITDAGLVSLLITLSGHSLQSLVFKGNQLTDASANALSAYVLRNNSLSELNLANNPLEDRGICILSRRPVRSQRSF